MSVEVSKMDENEVIEIRKEKLAKFFRKNYNLASYVVLAIITYLAVKIRTSNLAGLKDITTGTWALGPDLDPFLFLRWAKHVVEHGSLMTMDFMRYVPLGYDTSFELAFHTHLMVWFHKIASVFGSESITHSSVLYPAFMFGLTVIAFFFLVRKVFIRSFGGKQANMIAIVASFFLSVIPALLPRTVAGIPEKESSALVFLFLAFYFFICAWQSERTTKKVIYALLSGISTALMGLVWGGYVYIFAVIGIATFVAFILGKVDKRDAFTYFIWIVSSIFLMIFFTNKYTISAFLVSNSTGVATFSFLMILVDLLIFDTGIGKSLLRNRLPKKIPRPVNSLIITIIIAILLSSIVFGPLFVFQKFKGVKNDLVSPVVDRLGVTVAENRQPFFTEWSSSFGPSMSGLPITFWLFTIGAICLVYSALRSLKKGRRTLITIAFASLIVSVVFSKYSPNSQLNGENFVSLFFYALGPLFLILTVAYYYFDYHKKGELDLIKKIDFGLIFALALFLLGLISARNAVRLTMMMVPAASIMVSYLAVASVARAMRVKESLWRVASLVLALVVVVATLFAGYGFYQSIKATAPGHVPSIYTQQWQKAMFWVRENAQQDAVFGHWWDYGYWIQTIGERATVLDGGNVIPYWNHMMGRYALTGANKTEALDFLYAHETTHFLIDSTDIGKYSAFSTIGSNANYDRASYIPTFGRDLQQTQEKKNSTVFAYTGGSGLDEDIIYDDNGTRVFLPAGKAGLGAILVEKDSPQGDVVAQPRGIFVYQGQQYNLPFRYAFDGEFKDFGSGIESGVFLMPRAVQTGGNLQIEQDGALLYLSRRTVKSQLARLYLYKEEDPNFRLVHSEDDLFVSQIKSQNPGFEGDIINYQGLRGPIRIWEIDYPEGIEIKERYLDTHYPEEILWAR